MTLVSGARLGSYEIISLLGAGGMGEVYRAHDLKLGREVAIKVLPEDIVRHGDRLARFEREAHVLAAINHPAIAVLHGFAESEGRPYLVMEFVDGEGLDAKIASAVKRRSAGQGLPLDETLDAARQIADALEAAHEHGIVHRDLKPANVKVRPDGMVKVLDFGLAKVFERSSQPMDENTATAMTGRHLVLGTPAYMSPEQARGEAVDERTDVWAFGCVLFEALAGRPPFRGRNATETLAEVLQSEPPWAQLPMSVPQTVRLALRCCLSKKPRDRFRRIADVRIVLDEALVAEKPASTTRRVPWPWVTAAMTAGAAIGLLAGFLLRMDSREERATDIVVRSEVPLPPGAAFSFSTSPRVAISPDGTLLAFRAGTGLYLRNLSDSDARLIEGSEGGSSPFFSPDGRWLAFVTSRTLAKVAVSGGRPVTICALSSPDVRGASWGPDGTVVFNLGIESGLWRIEAAGGEPRVLTTPDAGANEESHRLPEFLPDGEAVLFTVDRAGMESFDEAEIDVVDLRSGERRTLVHGGSNARYAESGHLIYRTATGLFAVSFDAGTRTVTGAPTRVQEGVTNFPYYGHADFAFSRGGVLAYIPGGPEGSDRYLVRANLAGTLERIVRQPGPYANPRVSPNGRQVAFAMEGASDSIWLLDLQRGVQTPVAFGSDNSYPVWTRDGSRLTFSSMRSGSRQLFWQRVNGSESAVQLTDDLENPAASSWSPDGVLGFDALGDIWMLPASRGEPWPFLQTSAQEVAAMFSPDGRLVAYTSNQSGRFEIFVQEFPRGERRQVSSAGGSAPEWSPDGSELYYVSPNGQLTAARITTSAGLTVSPPRALFEVPFRTGGASRERDYDVFPGGSGFVMVEQTSERSVPTSIRLVTGWFRELARRIAP